MDELKKIVAGIAFEFGIEFASLMAFIEVESGGRGFDPATGKIIIQFEPVWFKKMSPYTPSGKWSLNGVERQKQEWEAFNEVFDLNRVAAMESTSIGLGQIMGLHWKRLGYKTVGQMWDDAKSGLDRQVWQIAKFIETDLKLQKALAAKDWHSVACIYNGPKYRELAIKLGRTPYDQSMRQAYKKYSIKQ
ncbi:MAG: N-acetylmuramidase family protein [Bacteroidales bacterium]|nr:N-acetylmuramidase family protein [Bacteroidales bacterium]